ncbi:hypothetical protein MNB_SV-4-344 [hydrothermal vent metagenome]|uniref:Uncharacterized protein n=1 Tax=hydrothermal vent metagenome TaxID=652676 RepID=A0A1W1E8Q4_9ZZZZ
MEKFFGIVAQMCAKEKVLGEADGFSEDAIDIFHRKLLYM